MFEPVWGGVVNVLTLADLQLPDQRVLRYTSLGFILSGHLSGADAAEFQQRVVATAELTPAVPDSTRASFERLRTLHSYGVLCYDAFTIVADLVPLVAEQAFRERFLAFYAAGVPVVLRDGTNECSWRIESIAQLVEELKVGKRRLRDWPTHDFRGFFRQLVSWARSQDLLSGQRARHREQLLLDSRNRVAHPDHHHLVSPVESARAIQELAEVINRIWGERTPGGRLYPAPAPRDVLALAFDDAGGSSVGLAEGLTAHPSLVGARVLLVRGVLGDEGLFDYDAGYEQTRFATDWLWGPGGYEAAIDWVARQQLNPDAPDHLDRWFVVRVDQTGTDTPRRPSIAAGLPASELVGTWHLVQADFPEDAYTHVRYAHEPFAGVCKECAADGRATGSWADLVAALALNNIDATPVAAVDARMPRRWMP